jgi:hypothetical protein
MKYSLPIRPQASGVGATNRQATRRPKALQCFEPEASVETEVSLVSSRRLGGMARDLSSVRLYHTRSGQAYVAGVSGSRRSRLHFNFGWHIPENNQTSMEGRWKIEAKEQTEKSGMVNRRI